MTDSDGRFDDLFSDRVRANLGGTAYGRWRAIATADAVPLHFGFPYPDSFPQDELLAATETVLAEEGERALQYGGGDYVEALESFVAERASERGVVHGEDGVLVTNGATDALDLLARTFLDPGDPLVVEAPTFMGALSVYRDHGVEILDVPVDEDGMDVEALADLLATRAAAGEAMPSLVYTIPNFHNPAGVTLSTERRHRLLDLAAEYDFVVVEDDAYGDLRYDGEDVPPLSSMDGGERAIHVGTFSKTIGPGVRTGWLVADPEIAGEIDRINAGGSNTFLRSVLGRYCEAGHFEPTVADLRAGYAERRDRMLDSLDEHMPAGSDWSEPNGGFFVWAELPEGVSADAILEDALDAGVAYLPGTMFYAGDDGRGERKLRLSFSHADPDEIETGIRRLGEVARQAMDG